MRNNNTPAHLENDTPVSQPNELPRKGLLRAKQILPFIGISKTTLWDWSQDGRFPAYIKLSPTMTVWRASDVHQWLASYGEV